MQICLSLVALFLAVVLINVINFPPSTKNALYIASLGLLISGTGAYGIIYEAKLRMEYSLLFNLANRIVFLSTYFSGYFEINGRTQFSHFCIGFSHLYT